MDNTAFDIDEESGQTHLQLTDLKNSENTLYTGGDADPIPPVRRRKVAPAEDPDGRDDASNSGETQEDYNIFTYLPNYGAYKKRYTHFMENDSVKLFLHAGLMVLLVCAYGAYVIAAVSIKSAIDEQDYWCEGDGLLLVITTIMAIMLVYFLILKKYYGATIYKAVLKPFKKWFDRQWEKRVLRWCFYGLLVVAIVVFLVFDTADDRQRLVSLVGLFLLMFLGFVFSYAPRKVVWRHVLWGLTLQFILGLMILRWSVGKAVFECAGNKVSAFLAFTDAGSSFVFGELVDPKGIFGFTVLPVVLFFSFCIQILYYYGIMQWVVIKMGWLLQVTVGTTACESVNAAANIFLGQTEAPLLIKPYLPLMTKSELHAVLTGGFATIAGSVMAAYISFGVSASHLLSASVMSAPAALAYAKLFYPETEKSRTGAKDVPVVKGTEANVLHAAIEGVVTAIPLVANIAANLITFIAFIAFFNGVFNWSCQLVNVDDGVCTLENVFGYVFMPLAWTMGVAWNECHTVGTLIGLKTVVNEFVAYSALADLIKAGELSARAEIIATYALCGFSNIGAIGIQLGGIGALAPDRRGDIAQVIVRAMIAGSAACFLTGCVAGTLLDEKSLEASGRNATQLSALL